MYLYKAYTLELLSRLFFCVGRIKSWPDAWSACFNFGVAVVLDISLTSQPKRCRDQGWNGTGWPATHKIFAGPEFYPNNDGAIDGVYLWDEIQWYGKLEKRAGAPTSNSDDKVSPSPKAYRELQANSRQQLLVKETHSSHGDLAPDVHHSREWWM